MSDWKQGAAKRRDNRNVKAPESTRSVSPKPSKKKDTKRWCRGKEGVEHQKKCVDYRDAKLSAQDINGKDFTNFFAGWKLLICTKCGKELDNYYPMNWGRIKDKPPPDWVV